MSTKSFTKALEIVFDSAKMEAGHIVEDICGDICFVAKANIAMTSDFMTGIVNRTDEIKQNLKERES